MNYQKEQWEIKLIAALATGLSLAITAFTWL